MKAARPKLRFLVDEGVPNSVGRVLEEAGHEVFYGNKELTRGSTDPAVCTIAEVNNLILVAIDGDMKVLARGHGVAPARFTKMSLLKLGCAEPEAAARVGGAMNLIEFEWCLTEGSSDRRLFIEIQSRAIRTHR